MLICSVGDGARQSRAPARSSPFDDPSAKRIRQESLESSFATGQKAVTNNVLVRLSLQCRCVTAFWRRSSSSSCDRHAREKVDAATAFIINTGLPYNLLEHPEFAAMFQKLYTFQVQLGSHKVVSRRVTSGEASEIATVRAAHGLWRPSHS